MDDIEFGFFPTPPFFCATALSKPFWPTLVSGPGEAIRMITAKDDPIIPVEDFYRLKLNGQVHLAIHPFGGHNGFIHGFSLRSWYEPKLVEMFDEIVTRKK